MLYSHSIAIIGAGAIGGLFSIKLKEAGYAPVIFTRKKESVRRRIVCKIEDKFIVGEFDEGDLREKNNYDLLIIAVKSYDLEDVIKSYKSLINNSAAVILIQSNINLLKYDWGDNLHKIYLAPVMIGAMGDYRSIIYYLNSGSILLGAHSLGMKKTSKEVYKLMSCIAKVFLSDNIEYDLFLKVSINTALYPLAVLNCCDFGRAYNNKENINFASKIFHECIQIANAVYGKNPNSSFGGKISEYSCRDACEFLKRIVLKYPVVFPSLLVDILKKKKEIELRYFYDDLIGFANDVMINVPNIKLAGEMLAYYITIDNFFDDKNIDFIMKEYERKG